MLEQTIISHPPASLISTQPTFEVEKPAGKINSSYNTWNNQNKLWSSLAEVGEFLNIPNTLAFQRENASFQHIHFKAGQRIHTLGQTFDCLFLINSGFLKTILFDEFGNEQVLNFPMKGDVLGIDSIHSGRHNSEAIALSDCDIILLPFKTITALGRQYESIGLAIFELMSLELARQQTRLSIHGAASAEARVGKFLLALSERYFLLGYSKSTFNLRMTRNDMGSYLGLTLETVSRTLSALNLTDIISVSQRRITINDALALRNLRKLPTNKLKVKVKDSYQSKKIPAWTASPVIN